MINQVVATAKQALKETNPEVKRCSLIDWGIVNHGTKIFTVSVKLASTVKGQPSTFDVWVTKNIETGEVCAI